MPALVAGIHVFLLLAQQESRGGRDKPDKPGHDDVARHCVSRGA